MHSQFRDATKIFSIQRAERPSIGPLVGASASFFLSFLKKSLTGILDTVAVGLGRRYKESSRWLDGFFLLKTSY